eukprot:TRINITY_DN15948_c0_g2_i1.p1 TRINITY_DN15948_c0_g2~~TRINITY_DN15948_c0_g2_i1.p1  ORF type:complete len:436 (+),score=52.04 TRINITY_DN15948_c0_g2_i1:50-1357(+)
MLKLTAMVAIITAAAVEGKELSIVDFGAVMTDREGYVNRDALQHAMGNATAADVVVVPEGDWYALGGASISGKPKISLELRGWLRAVDNIDNWPLTGTTYNPFINFGPQITVNMTGQGGIDGQGVKWWNIWIVDPPHLTRPKLIVCYQCVNSTFAGFTMHNSPSYHLDCEDVKNVEIANVTVLVDRAEMKAVKAKRLTTTEPEDLNTDGFDVSGTNVYIHDCYVQNDDDSIAVKPCSRECVHADCSENMVFERNTLIGVGATIGSVPPSPHVNCVRNITFRDIKMPGTGKGIYIKSNPRCQKNYTSIIQDVLYERVEIIEPAWWAIWIGPQQMHEPGQSLGDRCALTYPIDPHCPTQGCTTFKNIVLKDIVIRKPLLSPGVVMGNASNPMTVTFDNVTVVDGPTGGKFPFGNEYECKHTSMIVKGGTHPAPRCSV